jgi:hypothetical protein
MLIERPRFRRHLGLLLLATLAGCTGATVTGDQVDGPVNVIDASTTDADPSVVAAREEFASNTWPNVLQPLCASCHAGGGSGPGFLAGATAEEVRVGLLGSGVTSLTAPSSSRLLTKGAHLGPAFNGTQASAILDWINLERVAAGGAAVTIYETPPYTMTCDGTTVNTIELGVLGAPGSSGSSISFKCTSTSFLYATNITVTAGSEGVYINHPLFLTWNPDKTPDEYDRLAFVKANLMAGQSELLGAGTYIFTNFNPVHPISISFRQAVDPINNGIDVYRPDAVIGGVGCRKVDSFWANAMPQLTTFYTDTDGTTARACAQTCHAGGNAAAKNTMDLSLLDPALTPSPTDEQKLAACNQVFARVNKEVANIASSPVLLAPSPNDASTSHNHTIAGANDYLTFFAALETWITEELTQ